MGQAITVPEILPVVSKYVNLPKEAVKSLWTSYNLLGEGWGLSLPEVKLVFQSADFLQYFPDLFDEKVINDLFEVMDTDNNGIIDAIELFVVIALVSGMCTFCIFSFLH